ncbi:MAG TPA: hypothetical protein PKK61_07580 [Defluviitaleaceae bacterium]|nr:hypothetical protein [Defluviitaleaceae bacterium]
MQKNKILKGKKIRPEGVAAIAVAAGYEIYKATKSEDVSLFRFVLHILGGTLAFDFIQTIIFKDE